MPLVSIHHLAKTFEGNTKVLKDISFDVNEGECLTIIGPSGSGKSTAAKLLLRSHVRNDYKIVVKDGDFDLRNFQVARSQFFDKLNISF